MDEVCVVSSDEEEADAQFRRHLLAALGSNADVEDSRSSTSNVVKTALKPAAVAQKGGWRFLDDDIAEADEDADGVSTTDGSGTAGDGFESDDGGSWCRWLGESSPPQSHRSFRKKADGTTLAASKTCPAPKEKHTQVSQGPAVPPQHENAIEREDKPLDDSIGLYLVGEPENKEDKDDDFDECCDPDSTDMDFFVDVAGADDEEIAAESTSQGDALIRVPAAALDLIVGDDGKTLARLSAASGAQLSVVPSATTSTAHALFAARGAPETVAVARRLLLNLAAELPEAPFKDSGRSRAKAAGAKDRVSDGASGHAGEERGICKWFAAGFCRNRTPGGCCKNGAHDSEAGRRAEESWVREAPDAGSIMPAKLPVLLLLDLEGGGNSAGRDGEDEIIEVPVLAICPVTGCELGRFHRFSRPGFWDRSREYMMQRHSAKCFNDASSAVPFPNVMQDLRAWICTLLNTCMSDLRREDFLFVTCGNWDVKTVMPRQCSNPVPGTVDKETQELLLWRWSNLKDVFRKHFQLGASCAPTGMRGMLRHLKMPLAGQHHLGMDDVSNLAKILRKLILQGAAIEATGYAAWAKPGLINAESPYVDREPSEEVEEVVAGEADEYSVTNLGDEELADGLREVLSVAEGAEVLQVSTDATDVAEPESTPAFHEQPDTVADVLPAPFWDDRPGGYVDDLTTDQPGGYADDLTTEQTAAAVVARPRSARSILEKYSAVSRADKSGQDVFVKRKVLESFNNLDRDVTHMPSGGRGNANKFTSLRGGKCRRLQR